MVVPIVRGFDPNNGKVVMEWTTVKTLGRGSYGIVDLIKPINFLSDHHLAVKYSLYERSGSIRKESHILRQFRGCNNVVQCYGDMLSVDVKGNWFYNLLLEYAPNATLWDLIKKHDGNMPVSDVKCYTKMLLQGIRCVHEKGYVHCDLKPENILVFPSRDSHNLTLKIADFGLVRRDGEEFTWRIESPISDTSSDYIRFPGTLIYMPPEEQISCKLDIWSIGCIVLEMLTGKRPWEQHGIRDKDLGLKIRFSTCLPVPDDIPESLSNEGKDFLLKCFARDPCERWSARMLLSHPFLAPTNSFDDFLPSDQELEAIMLLPSDQEMEAIVEQWTLWS